MPQSVICRGGCDVGRDIISSVAGEIGVIPLTYAQMSDNEKIGHQSAR